MVGPTTMAPMQPPSDGNDWVGLTTDDLPVARIYDWARRPDCGAVVLFSGIVRDHAADANGNLRDGVTHLDYEAYEEQVIPRFEAIIASLREKWPETGRVVIVHRTGRIELEGESVIVAVSAPHRGDAFEAARYGIDTVKGSAPIWKKESWEHGDDWALGAQSVRAVPTSDPNDRH